MLLSFNRYNKISLSSLVNYSQCRLKELRNFQNLALLGKKIDSKKIPVLVKPLQQREFK